MSYPPIPPGFPAYPYPPGMPAPMGGLVMDDIPCRKCGYNLRTLPMEGLCPECGSPIGRSIRSDWLRYSDPEWVQKLARGSSLIVLGVVVMIFGLIATTCLVPRGLQQRTLQQAVSFGANILILIGSFLITEPDPSGLGEDKYGTSRKVIRWTLCVAVVSNLVSFFGTIAPPEMHTAITGLAALLGLAGIVGFFAQLQYYSKLALRIPDSALARRAKFLQIAFPICYGLIIVSAVAAAIAARGATKGAPLAAHAGLGAFICFFAIVGIAFLVFGVMYLFMIDRFRRAFKEQAALAAQEWSAPSPPPAHM